MHLSQSITTICQSIIIYSYSTFIPTTQLTQSALANTYIGQIAK